MNIPKDMDELTQWLKQRPDTDTISWSVDIMTADEVEASGEAHRENLH